MPIGPHPEVLGLARTAGGVNTPIRVGSTGVLNGSGTVSNRIGSKPELLLLGRTAGGANVPLLCDANGNVTLSAS